MSNGAEVEQQRQNKLLLIKVTVKHCSSQVTQPLGQCCLPQPDTSIYTAKPQLWS